MELELYVEDKRIMLDADPKVFETPKEDEISMEVDDYMPHLLLFSSGEMTAYEIRLRRDANDQELVMRGDILGAIELVSADE